MAVVFTTILAKFQGIDGGLSLDYNASSWSASASCRKTIFYQARAILLNGLK
jgi:hypothetical protein